MEHLTATTVQKTFIITGSLLLIGMGILHGSGMVFITNMVTTANVPSLIKNSFPVLFAHASLHLLGIGLLALVALKNINQIRSVFVVLGALVFTDALAAFYLEAWLPGIMALLATACLITPVLWFSKSNSTVQ